MPRSPVASQRHRQQPRRSSCWSWWTRPRAVSFGGVCYVGAVDNAGAVIIDEWTSPNTIRTRHTIATLTEIDDHNNPAVILVPGQVPVVIYSRHNLDNLLRIRRGTTPFVAGADLGPFAAEIAVDAGSKVTYVCAFVYDGTIWVWHRTANTLGWGFTRSTDWGATWTAPVAVFNSTRKIYMASVPVGDVLRCAISCHPTDNSPPDQDVYYFEVDLATGTVTDGSSTLGNLDGTNLPISWDTGDLVAEAPAGQVTWVFDVSDGPVAEIGWMAFENGNETATATNYYSYRGEHEWGTESIGLAGRSFCPNPGVKYFGGVQFARDTPGGIVYVAREASNIWHLERLATDDLGETWDVTSLATSRDIICRAWPVERGDVDAAPFEVAANTMQVYTSQGTWVGNVGGSLLPADR